MSYSLRKSISEVVSNLCRLSWMASRSKSVRWWQVTVLVVGLSRLGWGQCFQPAPTLPNYATPANPRSVAVGDFNKDNWPDMAVSNGGNISVFLNDKQGGFGTATDFPTGATPTSTVIGDFNGDGWPDLATANSGNNNISVLLNNKQGSFGASSTYAVGIGPRDITIGDFNGDGWPDLATANFGSNNVSVLLNNGQGGLGAATDFAVGPKPRIGNYPSSLGVGDFDGDGKLDLVVAKYLFSDFPGQGNMALLTGDGQGGFGQYTTFSASSYPILVRVGHFNNDTRPDIVVAYADGNLPFNTVSVLLGNGDKTFTTSATPGINRYISSITVDDFNSDGNSDLAIANYGSNYDSNLKTNNVSVLIGNPQGQFNFQYNYPVGNDPSCVAAGDFNGDGRPDLTVSNANANNVSVLYNCTSSASLTIVPVNLLPLCSASSLSLRAVPTDFSPTAYTWTSQPAGLAATGQEPTFALPTVSSPTVYTLTASATDGDGSVTRIASVTLTVQAPPPAALTNSGPLSTANPTVTLTASGGQGYAFSGTDLNQSGYSPTATVNTAGTYSVTVTSASGCTATASTTVVGIDQPVLTGLNLINADNGQVISSLIDGQAIDLSTLPSQNLSIRANTNTATGSVTFALKGAQSHNQTDSGSPFALFGNTDTNGYVGWTPPVGPYSLTVTPYAQTEAGGQGGQSVAINFTVYSGVYSVRNLSLVNADNGQAIGPLTYGQELNLSTLPTRNLFIQANTGAGGATFTLSGPQNYTKVESVKPFALFGDTPWTPLPGSYTLTVTAGGPAYTTVFTVIDPLASPAALTGLSLVNADNGQVISSLTNGQKLNLTDLPTRNLSIRADGNSSTGSVKFALSGTQVQTYTDSTQPFALFGNPDANGYTGWTPPVGYYNLTVTPYDQTEAGGRAGRPITLSFTIIDEKAALWSLVLVNADTGEFISSLTDGQAVNLATLPTRKLSIRANTNDATGSVNFALTGAQNHSKTESSIPFALFGDAGFDKYNPWTPTLGNYSLTVTPYSQPLATGQTGESVTVNFTVIDEVPIPPAVSGLSLMNADNGEVISPLVNGQVLNLVALPTRNLSIRADANQKTGSVTFNLTGAHNHTKTESVLPFALFGDTDLRNYIGWTPPAGQYYLTVTPHGEPLAGGEAGQPLTISFQVEDRAPARVAAFGQVDDKTEGLLVVVLGNPTSAESVEVDIRGAAGHSVDVVLSDAQGRIVSQQHVQQAAAIERQRMQSGREAGIYLLHVTTPTESTTTRVLRVK